MREINNIWQFFENMNEYVYATDIETYEMVYMTKSAKDTLKNGVIIIQL